MSLSLGSGLGITSLWGSNWWDTFRAGGFEATLVLSFKTKQYYNQMQKTLAELMTSARIGTKSAWDADGNITTIAATTPVQAYNPITLVNLGLVSELAISRINIYPECKDGTGWQDQGSTTTNLSLNILGVFDGASIASGGSTSNRLSFSNNPSMTDALVYSFRVYYRAGTSGRAYLRFKDISNGTDVILSGAAGSLAVTASTAGSVSSLNERLLADGVTYEVSGYITKITTGNMQGAIGPHSGTLGETIIALGFFIGGAGEKLPHCPIIGNDGSTVTVAADELAGIPDGSDPFTGYDQTKVSGKITITPNADGVLTYVSYNDGTANEVIKVHQDASNNIILTVTDGGVEQCAIDSGVNAVIGTEVTIAFRAGEDDFAISVNGNAEVTDTGGTMPTVTQQEFGGVGIVAEEVAYNELITNLAGLSA